MIRTVLIDDEIDSNRILKTLLENYCPEVTVVGTADGVDSAVSLIREVRPELVFMDIEMTQGNAFDLLSRLHPVNFQVIFVTAFDNHAVRAFKYNAVDYLLKPVNIRELRAAVDKLPVKSVESDLLERVGRMLGEMRGVGSAEKKIAFPTLNGLSFVSIRDIIRLESKNGYTVVHLENKNILLACGSIKEFEDLLPDAVFFRIHVSHIINLNKIRAYQKGRGGYVTMEDDSFIEVASRRREDFMRRLLK